MKKRDVLETTSQMSFSSRHLAATSPGTSLSNSCCKSSQQGPFLELLLCHTEEAIVVAPLFSTALEH